MKKILLILGALLVMAAELPTPPTPPTPKPPRKPIIMRGAAAKPVPKLADLTATDTNAPDYVVLGRLSITDGTNPFSADLRGFKYPKVQADSSSAVVIFPLRFTNYTFHISTNMGGFTNGQQVIYGKALDTNSALIWIDMHGGTKPMQFFRLTETVDTPPVK